MAVIESASGSAPSWNLLVKPTDGSNKPAATSTFCDPQVADNMTRLDLGISSLYVNDNATASAYSAAWTSDMMGDTEIYVMDVSGSSKTISNVSSNSIPK